MSFDLYRIRRLTCGLCGKGQRLRLPLEGEATNRCSNCGASTWLALPRLADPRPLHSPLSAGRSYVPAAGAVLVYDDPRWS